MNDFNLFVLCYFCLVVITGSDVFRGFFIQARDVATGQWIGQFTQAENLNLIPECSAITHADNQDKVEATLLWTAPDNIPKGRVYFTWDNPLQFILINPWWVLLNSLIIYFLSKISFFFLEIKDCVFCVWLW